MEGKIKLFMHAEFTLRIIYRKTPKNKDLLSKIIFKRIINNSKFLRLQ